MLDMDDKPRVADLNDAEVIKELTDHYLRNHDTVDLTDSKLGFDLDPRDLLRFYRALDTTQ